MENGESNALLNATLINVSSRDIEEEQTREYSEAVGCGISREATADLQIFLHDASPFETYASHSEIRFIYEILYKDGWEAKVRRVIDAWIEVRDFVINSAGDADMTQ
jgi:hypothetical protein